ncbi:MAG TPA: 4Fe-4S dicluster domain-containing protein [Symbiobacteriaceae bacterium]|nr:4Fe-4S dicluster domain-containing protein [Symbiobacteriaceae bacterium]
MRFTRRKFLMGATTVGAGLALGPLTGPVRIALASTAPAKDPPAVLYDLTQCAGCHLCEIACQVNKGLPPEKALLSFRTGSELDGPNVPKGAWAIRRQQCMHCLDPACVAACPVAAMYKTPEGPVIYRDERCLGCRYCMNACPFNVPTFDWNSGLLDAALIRKCNFCYERQQQGKQPACIEACPTKAVIFGQRSEMLAEAKKRIAADPDRYVGKVYGEYEAGGTAFLLIAGVPFDKLALPDPGDKALPPLTRTIMGGTIPFALSWAAVLTGIYGVVQFRQKRMKQIGHGAGKEEKK